MTTQAAGALGATAATGIRRDIEADAQTEVARPPRQRNHRRRKQVGRIVNRAALVLLGLVFMYPFVWLISASFKPRGEVCDNRLMPQTCTQQN